MYLGIDIGSVSTNAVLVDEKKNIIRYSILPSGYDHKRTSGEVISKICGDADINIDDVCKIVSTGYGRENIQNTYKTVTEITCHAVGVRYLYNNAKVIIDIGGQDNKVIKLTNSGFVENFSMNDKCSAGTGRFLEVMASVMKMDLCEFSKCGLNSTTPYKVSSICTVFAESEVISAIAKGIRREDIVAGIYQSIANRIFILAGGKFEGDVILTGGVAKNAGIFEYLKRKIDNLKIPFEPQITGALGAALIAADNG